MCVGVGGGVGGGRAGNGARARRGRWKNRNGEETDREREVSPLSAVTAVCAYVRASILFFMSLVYLEFKLHPWSTCLLLYLSLSLVC